MQRVVVIGATGSGKTTLALRLASLLNTPAVDLDTLYWQPNWQGAPPDVFHARVDEVTRGGRWVISGNYSSARDLVWSRADTLVWLDYRLPLIFWRLLRRTIQRIRTQEDLWGTGNRETWRKQFFSRESLFLWVLQSRPRHHREYPQLFQQPEYKHLRVIRLHSPRETDQWIEQIGKQVGVLMTDDR